MEKPSFRELQAKRWDAEYRQKGSLWHGPGHPDLKIIPGSRVLELGCGNGKTLSGLLKPDLKLTAIDFSPRAVELCKKMAEREGMGKETNILVADACSLPFPDSSFDFVLAFHILEHMLQPDREKAVSEILRVLAPGGSAALRVFSVGDMRFGKGKEIELNTFMRGNKLAYHYFSENEILGLFSSFKKEKLETARREVLLRGKKYMREKIEAVFEKN